MSNTHSSCCCAGRNCPFYDIDVAKVNADFDMVFLDKNRVRTNIHRGYASIVPALIAIVGGVCEVDKLKKGHTIEFVQGDTHYTISRVSNKRFKLELLNLDCMDQWAEPVEPADTSALDIHSCPTPPQPRAAE